MTPTAPAAPAADAAPRLRILILAHFAGSPYHGMVYGHYYLAREWVRRGHEVTIVAASFAHTRHRQPSCRGLRSVEWIDGIRYLWVRVPAYSPAGRLGRVLNMLAFTLHCTLLRAPAVDLVILSSHFPLPAPAARRIARGARARLVFEVRDLWPLTLIELGGASPRNPFIRWMQWCEDLAYRSADRVVSVLVAAAPYMVSRGMEPAKFAFIPNGIAVADATAARPLPPGHLAVLDALAAGDRFLVGYAGRFGLANGLDALLEAAARLDANDVAVVLLGDGAEAPALRARAQALGIAERLHLLAPVDKAQVAAFLERMDVLYVGLKREPLFRFGVSPTKLNDYLLAGRPVLYAVDGPPDVIAESGAGVAAQADDPVSIAAALAHLRGLSAEQRAAMGTRGRDWVRAHRDYRVLARQFLDTALADPDQP